MRMFLVADCYMFLFHSVLCSQQQRFKPNVDIYLSDHVFSHCHLYIVFSLEQFPVRLSFEMVINKAQSQTLPTYICLTMFLVTLIYMLFYQAILHSYQQKFKPNVDIYFFDHICSHNQL